MYPAVPVPDTVTALPPPGARAVTLNALPAGSELGSTGSFKKTTKSLHRSTGRSSAVSDVNRTKCWFSGRMDWLTVSLWTTGGVSGVSMDTLRRK